MSAERSDISPRAAGWVLAGVLGIVALAGTIVGGFSAWRGAASDVQPRPPAPRAAPMLQASERSDRIAIEARARTRLQQGVPIEEAMRRTAAAGWDAKP